MKETKNRQIVVRVTPEMFDKVDNYCKNKDMSKAMFIRQAVVAKMVNDIEE